MVLAQIDTRNTLQMCGEVYGIAKNTTSLRLREFYAAIRVHLKALVIKKPTTRNIWQMAREFKEPIGIPYVMGTINGTVFLSLHLLFI